jgi:hypothetical protein
MTMIAHSDACVAVSSPLPLWEIPFIGLHPGPHELANDITNPLPHPRSTPAIGGGRRAS